MDLPKVDYIWKNGKLENWDDCTTHVLTHALHYGSGVFEGLRCYEDPDSGKSYVFRLKEHMMRLHNSAKIAKMDLQYSVDELVQATIDTVRENGVKSCYIRPLVYRGYGTMGIDPTGAPTDVIIACWPWGAYLEQEGEETGIKVGCSSWRQRSCNAFPPAVKATASYFNSILAKLEAKEHGYDEAIMLNEGGRVCEGTGENLFIVRDGKLITPPTSDGLLEGLTRHSVMKVAKDHGISVIEKSMVRSDLYSADEMFLTGSAAEIAPVAEVDGYVVGDGKVGEITKKLKKDFFEVLYGHIPEHKDWNFEVK